MTQGANSYLAVTFPLRTKPHISRVNGTWKCFGYVLRGVGTAWGFGITPQLAYRSWRGGQ